MAPALLKTREWLKRTFLRTWQFYRDFFQFTFVRYMVLWFALVPAALFIIQDIPSTIYIPAFGKINFGLPFNWWILWIGSVFFVIAYGLYSLYCPTFIRRYHSFKDYKALLHSPRWVVWESLNLIKAPSVNTQKFMERMITKQYMKPTDSAPENLPIANVDTEYTEMFCRFNGGLWRFYMPMSNKSEENEIIENEVFWEIFGRYAASRPVIRILISALLLLALACVVYIVLQNLWAVVRILLHDACFV